MRTVVEAAIDHAAHRLCEQLEAVAKELSEIKDELIVIGDAAQRARYFTENEGYGGLE